MESKDIRLRFAPSPTGYMHVGGARTAIFNYLFARHYNGKFILRIEDTDRSRYSEDAEEDIFSSLRWLGLEWDEGPDKGGDFGPYRQSERTDLYKEHTKELIDRGEAYYCFCSKERLENLREEQKSAGEDIGYDRKCRDLPPEEIKARLESGEKYVVRLRIPDNRKIVFKDSLRGEIEHESERLDDFVLVKEDGYPTYHMANIVDDHHMQISHVFRGEEWITSTPKHILLYEAFGWNPPEFVHLPVILDEEGGKLSKRRGAVSVLGFKQEGFLPEALFNFLSLLGWSPGNDREKMSEKEITESFTINTISPKSSVFDRKKLTWMNGLYMPEREVESILPGMIEIWKAQGIASEEQLWDKDRLNRIAELMKDRSKTVNEAALNSFYFFRAPKEYDKKGAKKRFKEATPQILRDLAERLRDADEFTEKGIENIYRSYADEHGLSGGKLIHPTRLAVSGLSFGPGVFELMEVVGRDEVINRMLRAAEWIEQRKGDG